ncbi:hypothetical protein [Heliophilum fasciatum]|uniref:Uncharacterized protein n=1 Tax=Heliophilum fasciatum TaxID=35700 RepID=A0A4R2RKN0_9FIRM|nr:hypothetical protein [Heliophilum fasciatum]MCW2278529.1 hypothetical protein [Heliophilum fasciatum]TCP63484.1 hypothetical protein EDD73_11827 [Heliophilum fasciatum]
MDRETRDVVESLLDQVAYLQARVNQLRSSRRVLMTLLAAVDQERRIAEMRLAVRKQRRRQQRIVSEQRQGKIISLSRNSTKCGE